MPPATIPLIFATSFAVGFSGAITPGPLLVYSIRESFRRGVVAGPLVVAGHALLELVVVVGLAVGVVSFLEDGTARFVISLLGGLFLVWMGWGMVRRPSRHLLPTETPADDRGSKVGGPALVVLGGALVTVSNPFWSLWWVTIGLGYMVWADELGLAGLASFYTGHILADLVWFGLVAFAIASGRRIMTRPVYQGLMVSCGLFLLALGGYFIVSGVDYI